MNRILSIILPIYNVEGYLYDCLSSLLDQNMSENEYEIVCVDDGSTDHSAEIIQQFQSKHSNLFLYQKENGGVGSARNYGLSMSTGDYITFVDPDDYLTSGSLALVLQILKSTESEMCLFKYNCVDEDAHWRGDSSIAQLTYEIKSVSSSLAPRGLPGLVIKKQIIDQSGIYFNNKLRNREDYIFNLLLFSSMNGKKIIVFNERLYSYRIRKSSLTNSKSSYSEAFQIERMQNMIVYVEECIQYLECHKECPDTGSEHRTWMWATLCDPARSGILQPWRQHLGWAPYPEASFLRLSVWQ